MENLEIISTHITVQAKQIINGNTANFTWNNLDGELPSIINFSVQRGVVGEEGFTGNNVITGAFYTQNKKFDVQNNNYLEGDLVMYQELVNVAEHVLFQLKTAE